MKNTVVTLIAGIFLFSCTPHPPLKTMTMTDAVVGVPASGNQGRPNPSIQSGREKGGTPPPMTLIDSLNRGKEIILQERDFPPDSLHLTRDSAPEIRTVKENAQGPSNETGKNWVRGFQIQILTTEDSREAESKKAEMEEILRMRVNVVYNPPYFKLRTGSFTSEAQASDYKKRLAEMGFDDVWVVKTRVWSSGQTSDEE